MDCMKYFGWYLAAVNIVAFIMYGIDTVSYTHLRAHET